MKKLSLKLDELKVQSFKIEDKKILKGTVNGNATADPEVCYTEGESCGYTCECKYTVNYPGICYESQAVGSCPYQNC